MTDSFTVTLTEQPQALSATMLTSGPPGATGQRGSLWFQGNGAPGVIPNALPQDMYLDNVTGNVYVFS